MRRDPVSDSYNYKFDRRLVDNLLPRKVDPSFYCEVSREKDYVPALVWVQWSPLGGHVVSQQEGRPQHDGGGGLEPGGYRFKFGPFLIHSMTARRRWIWCCWQCWCWKFAIFFSKGMGVSVTILDDGIEKDHPDLIRYFIRRSEFSLLSMDEEWCWENN